MNTTFAVRNFVCCPEKDPLDIQHQYDLIDHAITLVGEVPLSRLYRMPISDIAAHLENRIKIPASNSAHTIGAEMLETLKGGAVERSNYTLGELVASIPATQILSTAFPFLSPPPPKDEKEAADRAQTVALICESAAWITPLDLFTKAKKFLERDVLETLRLARASNLFGIRANDKCCVFDFPSDYCRSSPGNTCYIIPTSGACSGYSDNC